MPEYQLKPLPRISRGAKNAEKKRVEAIAKKESKDKKEESKESAHKEQKEKMHSEMIVSNKEIVSAIGESSKSILPILSGLKSQIAKIELEIPELVEGDKISKSMQENAKIIESALGDVVGSIKKIELDIPKQQDLKAPTKSLTDAISKSMTVIKTSLAEINESIMDIRLEQEPQPIEWDFDVSRDDKGYIKSVKAVAFYGEEIGG